MFFPPQWVGSSCGLHGPYIFYKAFKYNQDSKTRILSLGDFFFVRCKPEDPICVAELQLLWEERTSKQLLSSSKLYFLPEDTPQGRTVTHGEVGHNGEHKSRRLCLSLISGTVWMFGSLTHAPITGAAVEPAWYCSAVCFFRFHAECALVQPPLRRAGLIALWGGKSAGFLRIAPSFHFSAKRVKRWHMGGNCERLMNARGQLGSYRCSDSY